MPEPVLVSRARLFPGGLSSTASLVVVQGNRFMGKTTLLRTWLSTDPVPGSAVIVVDSSTSRVLPPSLLGGRSLDRDVFGPLPRAPAGADRRLRRGVRGCHRRGPADRAGARRSDGDRSSCRGTACPLSWPADRCDDPDERIVARTGRRVSRSDLAHLGCAGFHCRGDKGVSAGVRGGRRLTGSALDHAPNRRFSPAHRCRVLDSAGGLGLAGCRHGSA